jgi:hypothetical protein
MATFTTITKLLIPGLLCAVAPGQSPVPVLHIGDSIAGMGNITEARRLRVNDHGDWLAHVETDSSDTTRNRLVVRSGSIHLKQGDPAPGMPAGYTIGGFLDHDLNDGGDLVETLRLWDPSGNDARVLYLNSTPLLVSGDSVSSSAFAPGSTYTNFYTVHINDAGLILVACIVHESGSWIDALIVLGLDASGGINSENVFAREGDIPPGQTKAITHFIGEHSMYALNDSGDRLWSADINELPAAGQDVLYQNQTTLLAQSGQSSVVSGRDWNDTIGMLRCDISASGSVVFRTELDASDTSNDQLIVQDNAVYLREGGAFPPVSGAMVEGLGYEVFVIDTGEVFHYCDWDGLASLDEGLFLGSEVIACENITQTTDGKLLTAMRSWDLAICDDGDFIMYRGTLDGSQDAILLNERNLGSAYCSAESNSTGAPSVTLPVGSTEVSLNALRLQTQGLPPSQFGYYVMSMARADVLYPGGSNGRLCLGGRIGRLMSEAKLSSSSGVMDAAVDLTSMPVWPRVAANPGETWYFQAWHRDLDPGLTSNFSVPTSVTLR